MKLHSYYMRGAPREREQPLHGGFRPQLFALKGPGPRRTPARPPAGAFLVEDQDIAHGVVALVQVVDLAEAGVRLVLGDAELVGGFGRAPVVGRGVLDAVLDPDGHLQLRGSTSWAVVLSSPATVTCATAGEAPASKTAASKTAATTPVAMSFFILFSFDRGRQPAVLIRREECRPAGQMRIMQTSYFSRVRERPKPRGAPARSGPPSSKARLACACPPRCSQPPRR